MSAPILPLHHTGQLQDNCATWKASGHTALPTSRLSSKFKSYYVLWFVGPARCDLLGGRSDSITGMSLWRIISSDTVVQRGQGGCWRNTCGRGDSHTSGPHRLLEEVCIKQHYVRLTSSPHGVWRSIRLWGKRWHTPWSRSVVRYECA